ncbi:UvrD-helicase domain-containing protein [Aquimarina brevivitae]|uniref:DNA 3'-5' helicase n=1 Tax=Aquimarina brevivitae TaxID=323412 RepID=A0A4Q7PI86_9FLAO|nr:UvrD-helicase domain-containing protein [Aquimarina brevivitae]RZS99530.1 ATP-dependent exoDNAse (exonuclease V) beta subunit [Aquimarina brevivitae]
MDPKNAFTIYNAAAGAGKTYTLVKEYLSALLSYDYKDGYKNILAITFTNKAVAEMKSRILENLSSISGLGDNEKTIDLVATLVEETNIEEQKLRKKAERILKSILHNYASFDVVTIDTFTHRIIRTFAFDLGIPMNFEIEMDTQLLLREAVDVVLSKIGTDEKITRTIIDFAFEKQDEDKSWDISTELFQIGKLIHSENDRAHIQKLSSKTIEDFETLKKEQKKKLQLLSDQLINASKALLAVFEAKGLVTADFNRGSVPNYFNSIAAGKKPTSKPPTWTANIAEAKLYTQKLDADKKSTIDNLRPEIENVYNQTKRILLEIQLTKNLIKNSTPLSVLTILNRALEEIKKERNILLISEFNTIISNAIKGQPAPFIYERLGERYKDYFIDEFQDTSELQWNNLIPLIDNALATETLTGKKGSLTIVGDAKQAIYRWRGGKAEQFIDLSNQENPFAIPEKSVHNLPKNYRSYSNIITFNNEFFSWLSSEFISSQYGSIYLEGNQQELNTKEGGYVSLQFIEAANKKEEDETYPVEVLNTIREVTQKGFNLSDICILVRKQKEGSVIANYLAENDIPIISSETLLLQNAEEVVAIIDFLSWYINNEDKLSLAQFFHHISKEKSNIPNTFLEENIHHTSARIFKTLAEFDIKFNLQEFAALQLYESVIYLINSFDLPVNCYVQFFLDTLFDYVQKNADGIIGFLNFWNVKKDSLNIIAPEGSDAVQIMTIHKAKGLEFRCVIYPYANTNIYNEVEPMTWISVPPEEFNGFDDIYINYHKNLAEINQNTKALVEQRQAQLQLDNYNLLYVALTRAIEELYIISQLEITAKGEIKEDYFSSKFVHFLQQKQLWKENSLSYSFGTERKGLTNQLKVNKANKSLLLGDVRPTQYNKLKISTTSGALWDTPQEKAISAGTLIHKLLSEVFTVTDIEKVLLSNEKKGIITMDSIPTYRNILKKVTEHPTLQKYYRSNIQVYNEADLLYQGQLFRPDRITINTNNEVTVIDYKTGEFNTSHLNQIQNYIIILEKMGYSKVDGYLTYIDQEITVKPIRS